MLLAALSLSFDSNYPEQFVDQGDNVTIGMEAKDRYSSWCKVS